MAFADKQFCLLLDVMWPWTSPFWVHCNRTMPAILQIIYSSVSYKRYKIISTNVGSSSHANLLEEMSVQLPCTGLLWYTGMASHRFTVLGHKIVVVISCENTLFNLHVSYYSSRFCDNLNIKKSWNSSRDLLLYSQGKSWYYSIQKVNLLSMQNINTWKFVGCADLPGSQYWQ